MKHAVTYGQAIAEATHQAMELDPSVFVIGQGTRDKGQIFGSVEGLFARFGEKRVIEMPIAEAAMAGLCVGAALNGMRPVLVLQRADFAFLILDQIINHASKYYYMFGGQTPVPITVRFVVGKGWGQGPQHSQSLHSMFAHFPGMRVAAPADPYAAKGTLLNSIFSDDPTIIFEGRSLYSLEEEIPAEPYVIGFGQALKKREGEDLTMVATSSLVPEAIAAAEQLKLQEGVSVEVIDALSINPLDTKMIQGSVEKTGRLLIIDNSWSFCGISAEISAMVHETLFDKLKGPIKRLTLPFSPAPTAAVLEKQFYPTQEQIITQVKQMVLQKEPTNV